MRERTSGNDVNDCPRFLIRAEHYGYYVKFTIHSPKDHTFRGDDMFVVWDDKHMLEGRVKDDGCTEIFEAEAHFCTDREGFETFSRALLDAYDFGVEMLEEAKKR